MHHVPRRSRRSIAAVAAFAAAIAGLALPSAAHATGTTTGVLEVCKVASGAGVTGTFQFTVSGIAAPVSVPVGGCSNPLTVTAGQVTVTEVARAGFVVETITTSPVERLVSKDIAAGRAVVTVPVGTVANQTIVTVANKTAPPPKGTVKVCKVAGPGVAAGEEFAFTVGTTATTAKAGSCSLPITLPVGNVTVRETLPSGYEVTAITVTGAGALVSSDLPAASAVITVAVGVTEVTVTNKKPPKVTGCTLTKGYYKNHPDVVATLLAGNGGTLTIGGTALTAAQIDEIFGRNASNYLNQVSQQLIAARLNQLSGASTPAAVQTAINAAQALVQASGGPVSGTAQSQTTVVYGGVTYTASALVGVLSGYNEGTAAGGPPHCP
jgi:hypothetical protein